MIFLISIAQLVLYMISNKLNVRHGRIIILVSILIGYVFLFPQYSFPIPNPDGVNCGMPILGINLAFWTFGVGLTSITHYIYNY